MMGLCKKVPYPGSTLHPRTPITLKALVRRGDPTMAHPAHPHAIFRGAHLNPKCGLPYFDLPINLINSKPWTLNLHPIWRNHASAHHLQQLPLILIRPGTCTCS